MIYAFLLGLLWLHGPGETKQTVVAGGLTRHFILYEPGGLAAGASLVIALHGRLGTGAGMEHLTHFEKIAEREKFVLIYPDGIRKSWNDGRVTPAEKEGVDDVGFIRALIDSAIRHCGVDPAKVYVTGISNGGFMTMRLATELSDKIAAVAVVAATMDQETADRAGGSTSGAGVGSNGSGGGSQPVSVLLMHGTSDPLVPFDGGSVRRGAGGPILSHDASVDWWEKRDGCAAVAGPVQVVRDSAGDGTTVTIRDYTGGQDGSEVLSYVIKDGGHTWPGGWQYLPAMLVGKTSRNLDASEVIWVFFSRHRRGS